MQIEITERGRMGASFVRNRTQCQKAEQPGERPTDASTRQRVQGAYRCALLLVQPVMQRRPRKQSKANQIIRGWRRDFTVNTAPPARASAASCIASSCGAT